MFAISDNTIRQTVDESANKLVAGVFNAIARGGGVREEIERLLTLKRSRAKDDAEYMEILLNNIQFFLHMESALLAMLKDYLDQRNFPSGTEFSSSLERLVSDHQQTRRVSPEVRSAFDKYRGPAEKLDSTKERNYHNVCRKQQFNTQEVR